MKDLLSSLVTKYDDYVEIRYHRRVSNAFKSQMGRVDVANHSVVSGVGVRVLKDGAWGFSATTDLDQRAILRAIEQAFQNASALSKARSGLAVILERGELARLDFVGEGYKELSELSAADKIAKVVETEKILKTQSSQISLASCRYSELLEEKVIATSDGALASLKIANPEFAVSAIASHKGEQVAAGRGAGVAGGWQCLFDHPTLDDYIDQTARLSVDLLKAKYPEAGEKTVILAPAVVGLLCHEAIGHTVEADFVKAGSVAQGKLGQRVASDLVTMVDSGCENIAGYAVGNFPFDDEGVLTQTTTIIDKGNLTSYLHNKESAHEFGTQPTGNARAWLYNDEPLIRMRNTYMRPGTSKLDDMINSIDDGYLIEGAGGGQADSNGEFMFGCSYVWRISKGKKVELLREATLSGMAFKVLESVDAVSEEFRWDLGTGYCGKGQPAKVDAGGPYVKCRINVGGRQA
jgi:TldD protein